MMHKPNNQYHIPTRSEKEVDDLLGDQLAELRDEVIIASGGHPVAPERASAPEAPVHAHVLQLGEHLRVARRNAGQRAA